MRQGEEEAREDLTHLLAEKKLLYGDQSQQLARTQQENTALREEMRALNARNAWLACRINALEVEADNVLAIIDGADSSATLLEIANDTIHRNKNKAAIFIADIKTKNARNAELAEKKQLTTAIAKNVFEIKLTTATAIIAGLHQKLTTTTARTAGLSMANATLTLVSKLGVHSHSADKSVSVSV